MHMPIRNDSCNTSTLPRRKRDQKSDRQPLSLCAKLLRTLKSWLPHSWPERQRSRAASGRQPGVWFKEHQTRPYDELTGLPTQQHLQCRLAQAITLARRRGLSFGLLLLGLDHFRKLNATLGHHVCDRVLHHVAERILLLSREEDTIVRYSGDEFVILLPQLTNADDLTFVAQRIIQGLLRPFHIDDQEHHITVSAGAVLYPRDGEDADTLMHHADVALYRAKQAGAAQLQFYTDELNAQLAHRLGLEKELTRALQQGELQLYYQPQVSLLSGRISGMEALLRWQHPQHGLIQPAEFIPLAEESGLIIPIGEWVLNAACHQIRAWQQQGLPPVPIAVNISARQFNHPNFLASVQNALDASDCEPTLLELELTESVFMSSAEHAYAAMLRLREMGMGLSIDDFGTGYSSLTYLQRFPFDKLKIDRTFINAVTSNPEQANITLAIIAMARSLRLQTIAEGVETEAQAHYLHRHGCDHIQGYLFSHPITAAETSTLLRSGKRLVQADSFDDDEQAKLLVVDDDPVSRRIVSAQLELHGYKVITAPSAEQGFDMMARHNIQVVISDQSMPGMNGTDFLNRLSQLYPDSVRILLTADRSLETVIEAVNRGAVYKFLSKPCHADVLHGVVHEAFYRRTCHKPL